MSSEAAAERNQQAAQEKAKQKNRFTPKSNETAASFLKRIKTEIETERGMFVNLDPLKLAVKDNKTVHNAVIDKKPEGDVLKINWKFPFGTDELKIENVGGIVPGFVPAPPSTTSGITVADLKKAPDVQKAYDKFAKGNEKPDQLVKTPNEAKEFIEARSEGLVKEHFSLYHQLRYHKKKEKEALSSKPVSENVAIDRNMTKESKVKKDNYNDMQNFSSEITKNWLTISYLGDDIGRRFSAMPPFLDSREGEYIELSNQIDKIDMRGQYLTGTNLIIATSKEKLPINSMRTIAHEQLHYASWLGGGQDMRWKDYLGLPVTAGYISWLHEGLTEMHAQQLMRGHNLRPSRISYPNEMQVGICLQVLAGEDILKKAYLTGDFTEVRKNVNNKLGEGTFAEVALKPNAAEALAFLLGKLDAEKSKQFNLILGQIKENLVKVG
jgi:hypothetical protein